MVYFQDRQHKCSIEAKEFGFAKKSGCESAFKNEVRIDSARSRKNNHLSFCDIIEGAEIKRKGVYKSELNFR